MGTLSCARSCRPPGTGPWSRAETDVLAVVMGVVAAAAVWARAAVISGVMAKLVGLEARGATEE
eukprot:260523-Prymnesium_polylepis.1